MTYTISFDEVEAYVQKQPEGAPVGTVGDCNHCLIAEALIDKYGPALDDVHVNYTIFGADNTPQPSIIVLPVGRDAGPWLSWEQVHRRLNAVELRTLGKLLVRYDDTEDELAPHMEGPDRDAVLNLMQQIRAEEDLLQPS